MSCTQWATFSLVNHHSKNRIFSVFCPFTKGGMRLQSVCACMELRSAFLTMCSCSECHLCLMHYPSNTSAIWSGLSFVYMCVCSVLHCSSFLAFFSWFVHLFASAYCSSNCVQIKGLIFIFIFYVRCEAAFGEEATALNSFQPTKGQNIFNVKFYEILSHFRVHMIRYVVFTSGSHL